jgi:hypothetical protein
MSRPWRHGHCLRAPTGSPCPSASARTCRFGGRLAAMAQRQSNNTDPDSADEEVSASATASCAFGPAEKRTTISEIRLCVEDHFSEWSPGLHAQKSYNRRPGRLSAVFAPLAREALSEVSCQKTSGEMIRVADSIPTCVAKGQRALQGNVASGRLASVGYCSSKCVSSKCASFQGTGAPFHGAGAPSCRRAQTWAASDSGAGWTDARKRKRPQELDRVQSVGACCRPSREMSSAATRAAATARSKRGSPLRYSSSLSTPDSHIWH